MRALVIGGTLFIGRALVERLLERGDEVVVMHRGAGTPFGDRVEEIRCDRNDPAGVRDALGGRSFDMVFDNVYDWQRGTTAEQVSAAVLAVADGLSRYVFMSSIAVYDSGLHHDEDDALAPADHPNPYNAQKAETERVLFRLHRERGIPVTTLRPAFVYGPNNPFARESFFWDRILADRPVIIPGDGARPMQWVHAADVAHAAVLATGAEVAVGRAYNVAGSPLTQVEFVEALARAAGKEPRLVHIPRERIEEAGGSLLEPPLYFGAYLDLPPLTVRASRVRSELGLHVRPLEEGLAETLAWYLDQERPGADFSWEERLLATA
jgi:nucleoside-diphosphate-sugar epimerase